MVVKSYLKNNYTMLMDECTSNNNDIIINYLWMMLQRGYYCTLQYNIDSYLYRYFSPDLFDENTIDISECEIEIIGNSYKAIY